jgi:isochorismate synthase
MSTSLGFDVSDAALPAPAGLDGGLAAARHGRGITFVALPAQIAPVAALVAAWREDSLVVWSSSQLVVAGLGAACQLRGASLDEIAVAARELAVGHVHGELPAFARPRLLGGAAFAPGGAAAPPWTGFGDAWFVLPRWTYVHDGTRAFLVLAVDARDARHVQRWHHELALVQEALAAGFAPHAQPAVAEIDPGDRTAWRAQVQAITSAIAAGECEKIVAARATTVKFGGELRVADVLAELEARHEDCVRVIVRPPGAATLIAATPERLVKVAGATIACDALAGSHARGDHADPADPAAELLASAKDRREHALVVSAITETLAALGADVAAPDVPCVRTLRHVLHLHTPITAMLRTPRHVLEVAARLHPTPAVGGTPRRIATDWIASHEAARGWYAAPVGWCDLEGNGELAVAIRSGVIDGARAHLWAGAGIVAGSDPDRELAETDLKLRAMLGALGAA